MDDGVPSKLTDDVELGEKWINDPKKWYDVYTVKPYDYMEIVAMGGVPVFDKEQNRYVDKLEAEKAKEEAEQERIKESLAKPTVDYSMVTQPTSEPGHIFDGTKIGDVQPHIEIGDSKPNMEAQAASIPNEEDDLPF